MVSINPIRGQICAGIVGIVLGCLAGVTSFVFSLAYNPDITTYSQFTLIDDVAKRGGELRVLGEYEKKWDCGGRGIVVLRHYETSTSRTLSEIQLGDRPPGRWRIVRRFRIPLDAELGESSIQETLLYDCGSFRAIIRSPQVIFTVKE